jgi:3-hydroxyacyl-[acyl-carrier-protein] dehydratase
MLDYQEIRKYLPQQFPMIMVDKVLEFQKGKSLTAIKNVTANEIFFPGHFPGFAIMPGALILEGFGQSAAILYQITLGMMQQDEIPLYGSVKARFYHTVVPGDQLIYEIEVIKITSQSGLFKAVGRVDLNVVAKAELGLGKRQNAKPYASALNEAEQEPLITA